MDIKEILVNSERDKKLARVLTKIRVSDPEPSLPSCLPIKFTFDVSKCKAFGNNISNSAIIVEYVFEKKKLLWEKEKMQLITCISIYLFDHNVLETCMKVF